MNNALNWFEIPVTDLARAKRFYGNVLQADLREETMAGTSMAILPYEKALVGRRGRQRSQGGGSAEGWWWGGVSK